MEKTLNFFITLAKQFERFVGAISLFLINLYQLVCSPYLGRHCRFDLTCSDYAKIAIREHGFFGGSFKTFARLLKCQPFCKNREVRTCS